MNALMAVLMAFRDARVGGAPRPLWNDRQRGRVRRNHRFPRRWEPTLIDDLLEQNC